MQTRKEKTPEKEVIFGTRPVLEAIDSGKEINKLLILRGAQSDVNQEIIQKAKKLGVPFQKVPVERLNRITRKNHQGIIAFLSPIQYDNLEAVLPALFESGENPLLLVLDQVTDVRNLGAICRAAECMGVQALVLPSRGGAMINSDAVKTSAGAIFNLKICREDDLKKALTFLKQSGLQSVACTEKGKELVQSADFTAPTAIVMGSEDTGISLELMNHSDQLVRIPMAGKTRSLNVSVSAGIVLYECLKQRLAVETSA